MADIISKDNVRTVRYAHTARKKERKSGVPKVEIQGATYVFDATSRVKNLNPLVHGEEKNLHPLPIPCASAAERLRIYLASASVGC